MWQCLSLVFTNIQVSDLVLKDLKSYSAERTLIGYRQSAQLLTMCFTMIISSHDFVLCGQLVDWFCFSSLSSRLNLGS